MAARFANRNQELDYQANVTPAGKSAFEAARKRNPRLTYAEWAASAKHNKAYYRLGGGAPATGAPGSGRPGDPGVPAGLDPEQQQAKINEDYEISSLLQQAEEDFRSITDPAEVEKVRARILETYNRGVGDVSESLAGRGLVSSGLTADMLWDVNRQKELATIEHEDLIRRATERYAAIKNNLDTRKAASDLNFARMAGANIKAPVAAVPGQPGYTGPPKPPTNTSPTTDITRHPQAGQDVSRRRPGDTTYVGPTRPGGKSTVYKGKDWSKVAQLFPSSQFNVKPMPKVKR